MPTGPNRSTQPQRIVIQIDEIDLPNRAVHGRDKSNVLVVATFRETPAGILHVPAQNERWIAQREGMGQWRLVGRLDSADQQAWAEANLGPGDIKIEGSNIYLEGTVHGIEQGSGGQGLDGLDGSTGPQGPKGDQGIPGIDGQTGSTGPQGMPGIDGLDGSTGPQGQQGLPGMDGIDGKQGPVGLDGLDGSTGPQGAQGIPGIDGLDGKSGRDGIDGLDGSTGPTGGIGPVGLDGLDGSTGAIGQQGIPGMDGLQGLPGPMGLDGLDGSTAPSISFTSQDFSSGPPSSPNNGDIWYATNVNANGTVWQFRYNAGSASAYQWEFTGGAPLSLVYAYPGGLSIGNSTYTEITNLTYTIARAGDYLFQADSWIQAGASGSWQFTLAAFQNGVVVNYFGNTVATATKEQVDGTVNTTSLNVSDVITVRAYCSSTGTNSVGKGNFSIIPVRVS